MNEHEIEGHDEELPREIVDRLRARDRSVAVLTPEVDSFVARRAAAHFATRRPAAAISRRRRWIGGRRRWVGALAASVLTALVLVPFIDEFGPANDAFRADDVDGSGRVDVLDAYALARRRASDPAQVSEGRVDELMARIVSLDTAVEGL